MPGRATSNQNFCHSISLRSFPLCWRKACQTMWQASSTLLNCLQCDKCKRATTSWGSYLSVGQPQASPLSLCLSSGGVQSRPGAFGCTVWAAGLEQTGRNAQQTHDNEIKMNLLTRPLLFCRALHIDLFGYVCFCVSFLLFFASRVRCFFSQLSVWGVVFL